MKINQIAVIAICAGLFAVQFVQGEEPGKAAKMLLPDNIEMTDATVLKVFSAEKGDAKYKAYLVKWKNQEVVVTDMFGGPSLKEGDTVSVMATVVKQPTLGINVLQFAYVDMNAMMSKFTATQSSNNVKKKAGATTLPSQR